MTRIVLVCALVACAHPAPPAAPTPPAPVAKVEPVAKPEPPHNIVCDRLATQNAKAECSPEYTDLGPEHWNVARITIDGMILACSWNINQLAVVCDDLVFVMRHPAPQEDVKPEAKKPDAKKTQPPKAKK